MGYKTEGPQQPEEQERLGSKPTVALIQANHARAVSSPWEMALEGAWGTIIPWEEDHLAEDRDPNIECDTEREPPLI